MRDVLRKWTPREKYVKYQNLFYYLWNLSLGLLIAEYPSTNLHKNSVHCILTRSSKNAVLAKFHENPSNLYKFAQSGCIPPEIICEIFACTNQLAPHLKIMTPDKTANQWNNRTS